MWWHTPSVTLGGIINSRPGLLKNVKAIFVYMVRTCIKISALKKKKIKMLALLPFRIILVRDQMWGGEDRRVCRGKK